MTRAAYTCNAFGIDSISGVFDHWRDCARSGSCLQAALGEYCGVPRERVFLFASGRMGLYLLLKTFEVRPGDEVIIPGYTCVVVPNAVRYAGGKAVYADISEETFNFDTADVFRKCGPNTRAIVVPHNYGIPYEDLSVLEERCRGVVLIEDAAHALGSVDSAGRRTGAIGHASFFSFEYSKPVTAGVGGALVVRDAELAARVAQAYEEVPPASGLYTGRVLLTLLAHRLTSDSGTAPYKDKLLYGLRRLGLAALTGADELRGDWPSRYPARLPPILACLVTAQLTELDRTTAAKREIAARYRVALAGIPRLRQVYSPTNVYVRYPVLLDGAFGAGLVERLRSRIRADTGLAVGDWFSDVVHPRGSFRYGYHDGMCPVGESVARRILNLPVNVHCPPTEPQLQRLRAVLAEELA